MAAVMPALITAMQTWHSFNERKLESAASRGPISIQYKDHLSRYGNSHVKHIEDKK